MSRDILEAWKKEDFVISRRNHCVVLTNIARWVDHYDHLEEWCLREGLVLNGMVVECGDEQNLTKFVLKWS